MSDIRFRHHLPLLLVILLSLAAALTMRYGVMEPRDLLQHCAIAGDEFVCQLRTALPGVFLGNRLGLAALICGVLAFAFRSRRLAWPGLVIGLAGLVLYNFDYSAPGFLLSLLVLSRESVSAPKSAQQRPASY